MRGQCESTENITCSKILSTLLTLSNSEHFIVLSFTVPNSVVGVEL